MWSDLLRYNLLCVKSVELLRDYLMGAMALKIERKNSLEREIVFVLFSAKDLEGIFYL